LQTFLPFPSFERSARTLDQRRLAAQRVEALQVFNALTVPGHGYRHHPAAKMWRGYEEGLLRYALTMAEEWRGRGFNDTVADTLASHARERLGLEVVRTQAELKAAGDLPPWLGKRSFHRAHQSNLLRKDPDHYRPLFGDVPDDLDYVWPPGKPADP
jgi:hypothetical protein